MRLIDADALKEGLKEKMYGRPFERKFISSVVDSEPTIDAIHVVRCQECIHYEMGVCLKIYDDGAASSYAWQGRNPDDFCSYGERKEGADNE